MPGPFVDLAAAAPGGAIRIPVIHSSARRIRSVLERLDLGPDDMLLDLGCGDGRVLAAAAAATSCRVAGVEINAILAGWARTALFDARSRGGQVIHGDLADLGPGRGGLRRAVERLEPTHVHCYCGAAHTARIEAIARSLPTVRRMVIGGAGIP